MSSEATFLFQSDYLLTCAAQKWAVWQEVNWGWEESYQKLCYVVFFWNWGQDTLLVCWMLSHHPQTSETLMNRSHHGRDRLKTKPSFYWQKVLKWQRVAVLLTTSCSDCIYSNSLLQMWYLPPYITAIIQKNTFNLFFFLFSSLKHWNKQGLIIYPIYIQWRINNCTYITGTEKKHTNKYVLNRK